MFEARRLEVHRGWLDYGRLDDTMTVEYLCISDELESYQI